MRKSLAFLTRAKGINGRAIKIAAIFGAALFFLTATTGVFALGPVSLNWLKFQVPNTNPPSPPASQFVDVFGILHTTKGATSCSTNGCLWANTRYEGNTQYSRTYVSLSLSVLAQNWIGCDISPDSYPNHIAGRFGIDKSGSTETADTAYIPNGPVSTVNGGVTDMSFGGGAGGCITNNNLGTLQTFNAAGFLKTSSNNAYYIKVNGGGDTVMVSNNATPTWTEETPASGLTINDIDGAQISTGSPDTGKVFLATDAGLYSCTGAQYPACTTWTKVSPQPGISSGITEISLNKVLYKYSYLRRTWYTVVSSRQQQHRSRKSGSLHR